ncbi:MAG: DNA primase [Chloroherpetonaceae bacterium]|nr:DNA primase [Chloroherpetonaceae bacterium]MDW8438274.1 DNA primase [Chloroherpetonaceae bacterium]
MRLPEEKIDEIRRAADIVDVVSDYVRLLPSGRSYKAISPFNPTERTPSFFVSPEKQIYKCFSTGKGGNVFTFVQEMEKLSFIDAVKFVAKKVGIDLSQYERQASPIADKYGEEYDLMAWAAKRFHANLNAKEGKAGLEYLLGRGLLKETISKFGLGYALDSWDSLCDAAKKEGKSLKLLEEFGLIARGEKSDKLYDVFRARAMFPIFSPAGKVIAFGGRLLVDEKDAPKYINSPETRLYRKSEVLYGFNFARDEIRKKDEAILVEGYMDVISLHQAGVKTAVASSGTSLTTEQARLIARLTKHVLFVYDGDKAGVRAMMRGIDILLEQGISPMVLFLPNDEDPDSFAQKVGGEEFLKYANARKTSFLDFKIDVLRSSDGFSDEERTRNSVRELVGTIAKIPDELGREVYLKSLAEKLDVSLGALQKELNALLKRDAPKRFPVPKPASNPKEAESSAQNAPQKNALPVAERTFLKAMLESAYHGNEVLEFVKEKLPILRFKHEWTEKLARFFLERYEARDKNSPFDPTRELNYLDDENLRNFVSELLIDEGISERWQPEPPSVYARRCLMAFLDATRKIIAQTYDDALSENMRALGAETDAAKIGALITERNNLVKAKRDAEAEFEQTVKSLAGTH